MTSQKLPDKIFGIDTEEAYKRVMSRKDAKPDTSQLNGTQLTIEAKLNKSDYILIPNTNTLIAKEETYTGLKWKDTIYALADNGLFMPSPAIFMPYFLNVKEASEGKIILYDGNNKPIQKTEAEGLYKYLTTDYKKGCWTWLDAFFKKGSGFLGLDLETEHRVIIKGKDKNILGKKYPLENCVNSDSYVNLAFNKQGLPANQSANQKYKQGENIQFYYPRENSVARFGAGSDWAFLSCHGNPGFSDSSLGVFACAEGARAKI